METDLIVQELNNHSPSSDDNVMNEGQITKIELTSQSKESEKRKRRHEHGDSKEQTEDIGFMKQGRCIGPEVICQVPGCTKVFQTHQQFTYHYNFKHRFVCSTCKSKRVLPTNHLLELHVLETHDSFFAVCAERKPMYSCYVERCTVKFMNGKERKVHCVAEHKFPPNFCNAPDPSRFHTKIETNDSNDTSNQNQMETESSIAEIPKKSNQKKRNKKKPSSNPTEEETSERMDTDQKKSHSQQPHKNQIVFGNAVRKTFPQPLKKNASTSETDDLLTFREMAKEMAILEQTVAVKNSIIDQEGNVNISNPVVVCDIAN